MCVELLLHTNRISKGVCIPRKILFAIRVLYIKPDNIVRDVVFVKFAVDVSNVVICDIVPSTLVIGNGELLRKLSVPCKLRVRLDHVFWCRTHEDKKIHDTALREPMGLGICSSPNPKIERIRRNSRFNNIDPGLCSIKPENTNSRVLAMSLHERNGSIQRHRAIHFIFEDIAIVQSVWLVVIPRATSCI